MSKQQLNTLWIRSKISGGDPLPDRTFYHYRRNIEEIFNVEIKCDSNGMYYIENPNSQRSRALTNWLLDTMAVSSAINENQPGEEIIEIEDVPSAREFMPMVLDAIKNSCKLSFTYSGFSRSRSEHNIIFQPYFLKRYKQRWYMIGLKEKGDSIRTYALDRVSNMQSVLENF